MIAPELEALATNVSELRLLDGNPRKGDVSAVARSLARFGQRKPIVARRADRTVIAGNHTLRAARQLGWDVIACVFVDDDAATSKAYALADNRTSALGTFDDDALAAMVTEVAVVDESLLLAASFTDADIRAMFSHGDVGDDDTERDAPVENVPPLWGVAITCDSESEQRELLQRFQSEGLNVRALVA